jgi:hypothetical protein
MFCSQLMNPFRQDSLEWELSHRKDCAYTVRHRHENEDMQKASSGFRTHDPSAGTVLCAEWMYSCIHS